ncbi:MAG: peptide chain release factor aRF-1 [Nitrososphaerales archaeon]
MSTSETIGSKKFDSVTLYRIRKLLSELSNKSGRGTELVTLYLPPKKALHEAIAALREESGTASNIKSDTTRVHVQDALTKTMQRLRLYKQTPENGLVIFCGAIPGPGGPGNETIELYEVLPNKPVTVYMYRCIAPESKILLQNGLYKTMEELASSWKDVVLKSTEQNGSKISAAKVRNYIQTPAGTRCVYRITTESGRSLIATEDHPFFTRDGWKKLEQISLEELVAIYPADDFESSIAKPESMTDSKREIIVDEQAIRNMHDPPPNIELTVRRLKERGLLPLSLANPKLPLISRILGHMFSDGSFTNNIENRNGKRYSHYTLDICLGDDADVQEISADLNSLGTKIAKPGRYTHTLNIDGRSYKTSTIHIKFRDTAFCALLRAIGAPVGSKVKKGTVIPKWLFDAPISSKREFLAAYMGGDGESPRMAKSSLVSAIRLTFHRDVKLHDSSLKFADEVSRLFADFGIKINAISVNDGYRKKDGTKTFEYEIRFSLTEENVLKLCHSIGYRYSLRKSTIASLVGEYLRIKSYRRDELNRTMHSAREMRSGGSSLMQISNSLNVNQETIRGWTNKNTGKAAFTSSIMPDYVSWLAASKIEPDLSLVWEKVVSVEPYELQDVRDLTLDNEDHSFIANGFLIHNCDDHFHLEPLREMLKEENVIGVLALDSSEAGFGIITGDNWEVIDVTSSGVSGKTKKGGQSARRYERLREMELTDYYSRLADHAKKAFMESYHIKGLIISGPGPTKDTFEKGGYLDYRLQNMIIGTLDIGYSGREGVRETIEKSGKLLENVRVVEERKLVQKFLREVNSDTGLAIYGVADILASLKRAAIDTIIVNDDTDTLSLRATCSKCGEVREKFIQRTNIVAEKQNLMSTPCPKCGSLESEITERDIVDYLVDASIESGAKVEVISSRSEDGAMLHSFGGVAALLRYKI